MGRRGRRWLSGGGFTLQKRAFASDAPTIACELLVFSNYPVTRYRDGNRIRAARRAHGANGFAPADASGNLPVGCDLARRDFAQGPPNELLKRGAANIKRQAESATGFFDEVNHLGESGSKYM